MPVCCWRQPPVAARRRIEPWPSWKTAIGNFACDPYVVLEVVEEEFYRNYLSAVRHWVRDLQPLLSEASHISERFGLSAMDSLHVAAAGLLHCHEIVSTEKRSKPMSRNTLVAVVSFLD